MKKERKRERVEKKRARKYDEKEQASKIARDLKHLDLERESLRSQPSTHIHTLAHLIMFVCCFPLWIHSLNLQYKHKL